MTDEAKQVINWLNGINLCAGCTEKTDHGCRLSEKMRNSACSVCEMPERAVKLIERMSAELDAAKRDMKTLCSDPDIPFTCRYCKYQEPDGQCHHDCMMYTREWAFEWRGLCAENGGAESEEAGKSESVDRNDRR